MTSRIDTETNQGDPWHAHFAECRICDGDQGVESLCERGQRLYDAYCLARGTERLRRLHVRAQARLAEYRRAVEAGEIDPNEMGYQEPIRSPLDEMQERAFRDAE